MLSKHTHRFPFRRKVSHALDTWDLCLIDREVRQVWGPPCQWDKGRMHLVHTKLFPLLEGEIDGPITLKSFEKAKYRHQIHAKGQSCCYFVGEAPLRGWVWGSTCLLKGEYLPCFLLHEAGVWDNFPTRYLLLRHSALIATWIGTWKVLS